MSDFSREYSTFWYNKSVNYGISVAKYLHLTDVVDLKDRPVLLLTDVPPPITNGFFTKPDATGFLLCDYAIYLISLIPPMRFRNGVAMLSNISCCNRSEMDVIKSFLKQIEDFKRVKVTFYGLSSGIKASLKGEFVKNLDSEVVLVPNAHLLSRYIPTSSLPLEFCGVFYPYYEPWIKFIEDKSFTWHQIPAFTLDIEIVKRCDKVLNKFTNNQKYFGLTKVSRNPAFALAREKVVFYKSVLRLELGDTPFYQYSQGFLQSNHKSTQTFSDAENCRAKTLIHLANAVKLIQLKNEANSANSDEISLVSKLKKLLNSPEKMQSSEYLNKYSHSYIAEENSAFSFSKHPIESLESDRRTCENFTQTHFSEPPGSSERSTNLEFTDKYIKQMNDWYFKALSVFEDIDDASFDKISQIPEKIILRVDRFLVSEPLDTNLLSRMDELSAGSYDEIQDWKIMSYRINFLQKIMSNIKALSLPEIEEVIFWRRQLTLTKKTTLKDLELTQNAAALEFLRHDEISKIDHESLFEEDKFDDFMLALNKLLANQELKEEEQLGGEITLNDVDYDDFIEEISRDLRVESNPKSTQLDFNLSNFYNNEEANRSLDTRNQKKLAARNQILEDYDFTIETFKGDSNTDDLVLRVPDLKSAELDNRFDFQYLLPPTYESLNGKYFHSDSPKSIDSGVWNSPI